MSSEIEQVQETPFRKSLPARHNPRIAVRNVEQENSVLKKLQSTSEGRALLARAFSCTGPLQRDLCKAISSRIVEDYFEDGDRPVSSDLFRKWSLEVTALFPDEIDSLWFTPYLQANAFQTKRNQTGYLISSYRRRRKSLQDIGFLKQSASRKTSLSATSSKTSSPAAVPLVAIDLSSLPASTRSAEELETILSRLQSPHTGPWQDLAADWRETAPHRLRALYCEQGSEEEYIRKYPVLTSETGYRLLFQDFDLLFPARDGISCLKAGADCVIESAQKELKTRDRVVKENISLILENILDSAESRAAAALLLLPYCITLSPRKGATRVEVANSFYKVVQNSEAVREEVNARRKEYVDKNGKFQPYVILVVPEKNPLAATEGFVHVGGAYYKFADIASTFDACMRISHAMAAAYQTEAYDPWLFVQLVYYNIRTRYDRVGQCLARFMTKCGYGDLVTKISRNN